MNKMEIHNRDERLKTYKLFCNHTMYISVHELTPGDIGIIAAVGDSITVCAHLFLSY